MAIGIDQSQDHYLAVNVDYPISVCRCRVSGRRFDSGNPIVAVDSNGPGPDDTVVFIDANDFSVVNHEGIQGLIDPVIYR